MGETGVQEVAASVEAKIAHGLTWPMQWARHSRKKLWLVGLSAVMIGVIFIGAAGSIFQQVTFNLFPPSKDTNQLAVVITMPEGTSIAEAQKTAFKADDTVATVLGKEFEIASYYGVANAQTASLFIELTPYTDREPSSKILVTQLQDSLKKDLAGIATTVYQVDVGPPASLFNVQVQTEDREAGYRLANDVATYLRSHELTRTNGSQASFKDVAVSTPSTIVRSKAQQVIQVSAGFSADDTTTLVTLAQEALQQEFNSAKLATYGVSNDAIQFDLGQEGENQESFRGLVVAFPIVLIVIFLLLAIEFRSLLQPLLIFLAIPFSLFGLTLGLFVTNNAFSFFCAMGFFALIGLSIKNTILVVDYANQSRRAGMNAIDAATAAIEERFRPLIATSLTAVFSLIPLALSSPFWQGLAVVLIGGLISSTFLVITVFPYYYLGGEYLRSRVSRKAALIWLGLAVLIGFVVTQIAAVSTGLIAGLIFAIVWPMFISLIQKRKAT